MVDAGVKTGRRIFYRKVEEGRRFTTELHGGKTPV
jgi:hypothetical protein